MEGYITVLLADDHSLVRAGLRAILEATDDIRVVAEARDGWETLTLTEKTSPQVILLDISMPGLNGLQALEHLRRLSPHSVILILSMHKVEEYAARALRAGANGYLLKDTPPQELVEAVRQTAAGGRFLSHPFSWEGLETYFQRFEEDPLQKLTHRELQVLQLIAEGKNTQGIALQLGISPKTVETHRSRLMDKLGLYDVASLTRFAIRHSIIEG